MAGLGYEHKSMLICTLRKAFLLGLICLSNRVGPDLCVGGLNLWVVVRLLRGLHRGHVLLNATSPD